MSMAPSGQSKQQEPQYQHSSGYASSGTPCSSFHVKASMGQMLQQILQPLHMSRSTVTGNLIPPCTQLIFAQDHLPVPFLDNDHDGFPVIVILLRVVNPVVCRCHAALRSEKCSPHVHLGNYRNAPGFKCPHQVMRRFCREFWKQFSFKEGQGKAVQSNVQKNNIVL